jgi:hypothetical protein
VITECGLLANLQHPLDGTRPGPGEQASDGAWVPALGHFRRPEAQAIMKSCSLDDALDKVRASSGSGRVLLAVLILHSAPPMGVLMLNEGHMPFTPRSRCNCIRMVSKVLDGMEHL